MQNSRFKTFISNNLVAIVMIPTLVVIHYGWNSMQNNRTLVSESEKIDLPIVTLAKYLRRQLYGNETAVKDETALPVVSASTAAK